MNQRQAARLKRLSDYLADRDRSRFMFELLVPAEKAQLDKFKGDKKAYDRELRPRLMVEAIQQLQNAGVEPDIWKIEGLDRREDCEKIVAAARAAGAIKSAASFSVAARTTRKCENGLRWRPAWLVSSALPWAGRLSGSRWSAGGAKNDARKAVAEIARRYREFVDIFERAACIARPNTPQSDRNIDPPWRTNPCNWE